MIDYLYSLRKRHPAEQIVRYLQEAKSLRVLVVGETIIDEYCYCEAMGKSGKEPVLAVNYMGKESYAGGILAIANHLADFCDHVACVSFLGDRNTREEFVRAQLKENVEPTFLYKKDSPTLVKRRYVEDYLKQKLFEVYEMNDVSLGVDQNQEFLEQLRSLVSQYDVVIVADYGHGMMTDEVIALLNDQAKFLAVNAQANAGNRGLNPISRYAGADYVCIAMRELELEVRRRCGDVMRVCEELSSRLDCPQVMVTRGKHGSLTYNKQEGFADVPAFACKVTDRVGAGDSVLAITSLCMAQNAPAEVAAFIGNVVGAEAVAIMGHRRFIEKIPLIKHINHLLK